MLGRHISLHMVEVDKLSDCRICVFNCMWLKLRSRPVRQDYVSIHDGLEIFKNGPLQQIVGETLFYRQAGNFNFEWVDISSGSTRKTKCALGGSTERI